MKINKQIIDFLRLFPLMTPTEIEEFLEVLQDKEMLNEKGAKLKHTFWKVFWKDRTFNK